MGGTTITFIIKPWWVLKRVAMMSMSRVLLNRWLIKGDATFM